MLIEDAAVAPAKIKRHDVAANDLLTADALFLFFEQSIACKLYDYKNSCEDKTVTLAMVCRLSVKDAHQLKTKCAPQCKCHAKATTSDRATHHQCPELPCVVNRGVCFDVELFQHLAPPIAPPVCCLLIVERSIIARGRIMLSVVFYGQR